MYVSYISLFLYYEATAAEMQGGKTKMAYQFLSKSVYERTVEKRSEQA